MKWLPTKLAERMLGVPSNAALVIATEYSKLKYHHCSAAAACS
jgi:hypothetical protein